MSIGLERGSNLNSGKEDRIFALSLNFTVSKRQKADLVHFKVLLSRHSPGELEIQAPKGLR